MKVVLQITSVEPRIRMPACRSASPKNLNTLPPKISAKSRAANFAMSPSEATQSRGMANQVLPTLRSRTQGTGHRAKEGDAGQTCPLSPVPCPLCLQRNHLITEISGCVANSVWVNT